ncbi:hypothetical protein CRE_12184 [Caenorhabditis remanei]|uniref:Uncharacterized protein n=1 Tax=Caenorhabditis remanei TaxID=31234 RepID=E3N060_CAERE|nr:hypothetical protein CRE_12184 [Caenorhabditis remanei]
MSTEQAGQYAFMMAPSTQSSFFRHFEKMQTRNRCHRNIFLASLVNDDDCASLIEEIGSKGLSKSEFIAKQIETPTATSENPSEGDNGITWMKCQSAEYVPQGALLITHRIMPSDSIEKDVTVIVTDPSMGKELLGQLPSLGSRRTSSFRTRNHFWLLDH